MTYTNDGHGPAIRHVDANSLARFHALLIDNERYEHFAPVASATADGDALETTLKQKYGFQVTRLSNADGAQIRHALERLHELTESDALLIYFSGHGMPRGPHGAGYWLGVNAQASEAESSALEHLPTGGWVPRALVTEHLAMIRPTQVLVIDDSCYSGGPRGEATSAANAVELHAIRLSGRPSRPMQNLARARVGDHDPAKLAPLRARKWFSAGAEEVAPNEADRSLSLFTASLIAVLEDNDGVMTGTETFNSVQLRIDNQSDAQVPGYFDLWAAGGGAGDFLFIRKGWSYDEIDVPLGRVALRVIDTPSDSARADRSLVTKLVARHLIQLEVPRRPGFRAQHFQLLMSFPRQGTLSMTLVSPEDEQVIMRVDQALGHSAEELNATIRAAVLNLREGAETAMQGKAISKETVERALIAQRRHQWDFYVAFSGTAYVNFSQTGELNKPALGARLGIDYNLTQAWLAGLTLSFDTTKGTSSHLAYVGDIDSGTHANNRLEGQLLMHTGAAMVNMTLRNPYGLVVPFGSVGAGLAYHVLRLNNESFVPLTEEDRLPTNVINRRWNTNDVALAVEGGLGVNFIVASWAAIRLQGRVFKTFHDLQIRSQIVGFNQTKVVTTNFQAIQGIAFDLGLMVTP